jgi:thioredoxin reductase (NADPH)
MVDIGFVATTRSLFAMRTCAPPRLLVGPRRAMLGLMCAMPEMSDIIVSVFAARWRGLLDCGVSALTIVGRTTDRRVREILAFAGRNRIPTHHCTIPSPQRRTQLWRRLYPAPR